jgi:hypothetical protein
MTDLKSLGSILKDPVGPGRGMGMMDDRGMMGGAAFSCPGG